MEFIKNIKKKTENWWEERKEDVKFVAVVGGSLVGMFALGYLKGNQTRASAIEDAINNSQMDVHLYGREPDGTVTEILMEPTVLESIPDDL